MPTARSSAWALALRLLACVVPLWLLGCRAPPSYTSGSTAPPDANYRYDYTMDGAANPGGGGSGGYDDEDYSFEGDLDEPSQSAPAEMERMIVVDTPGRARASKSKKKAEFKSRNQDKAPATETVTATGTATATATGGEASGEPEPLDVDAPDAEPAAAADKRQIIYTATMQVGVYDLEHALELVERLPDRYGGWMHQRIDNQIVLRIPAENLERAMASVAELGVVDYRLLEALDVTAEYTDLESRIRVLEQMQAQLKLLLARATSVEQALKIREALDDVTLELEAARAQMRELAKSIAFSTLILRLVERGPGVDVPSSNDPFPWVDSLGVEATDYR